jgi:hypothetical protein
MEPGFAAATIPMLDTSYLAENHQEQAWDLPRIQQTRCRGNT